MRKARQRRHQQAFLPECGPVALRILQQLVALRDPERLAPSLPPVVEHDPGRLAALARASAIAKEEATAEADGVRGILGRGRDHVAGFIDSPRPREIRAVRLARVDHGLQLRVGQQTVVQNGGGQLGAIGRFGRCDRGHGRRLHQLGRVRCGAGDVDRLQPEGLINGIRQARAGPVLGCIAQGIGEVCGLDLWSGVGGGCW